MFVMWPMRCCTWRDCRWMPMFVLDDHRYEDAVHRARLRPGRVSSNRCTAHQDHDLGETASNPPGDGGGEPMETGRYRRYRNVTDVRAGCPCQSVGLVLNIGCRRRRGEL